MLGILQLNILHTLVRIVFLAAIVCLWVRVILSWLTMVFLRPDAPIIRFFDRITSPLIEPVRRRIPTMSLGMFDVGYVIAWLLVFWVILLLQGLLWAVLPTGW
jgi:uncharacterized protein YggT (Ycf19 family)